MSTITPNKKKLVTIKVSEEARKWLMHEKARTGKPVHETLDEFIRNRDIVQIDARDVFMMQYLAGEDEIE